MTDDAAFADSIAELPLEWVSAHPFHYLRLTCLAKLADAHALDVIQTSVDVMQLTNGLDIYRSGDAAAVREAEQRWAETVRRHMEAISTQGEP